MPDWGKNNYFLMAALQKRPGSISKLSLTHRNLGVFEYVIKFERNQIVEFLSPKRRRGN
jgi:hypothetical protein